MSTCGYREEIREHAQLEIRRFYAVDCEKLRYIDDFNVRVDRRFGLMRHNLWEATVNRDSATDDEHIIKDVERRLVCHDVFRCRYFIGDLVDELKRVTTVVDCIRV